MHVLKLSGNYQLVSSHLEKCTAGLYFFLCQQLIDFLYNTNLRTEKFSLLD